MKSFLIMLLLALGADWPTTIKPVADQVVRLEILTTNASGGEQKGVCSGVVIDAARGFVLTADHCVTHLPGTSISVTANGRDAQIVKENRILDLAVLKFQAKRETAMPLAADNPTLGAEVALVGFAFGDKAPSWQFGRVAQVKDERGALRLDLMVVPGQSGGAAINDRGELVGLVQAVQFAAGGASHVALTWPVDAVRDFVKDYLPPGK